MSFHYQTLLHILFHSIYLPVWTNQRRYTTAQLLRVFLCFIWGRPALLWCSFLLPSLHAGNVGCFSRWKQKAISLSPRHKVVFCFSLFIDLFIYFIYLMDVFPIFLSSSALMILPFLRGSLWQKTLLCLDLWKPYRKQWEMQVSIITWLKSCLKKNHICLTLISSSLQLLLPTNYSKIKLRE